MQVLTHLDQIVTLNSAYQKDGRRLNEQDLDIIPDGAIVHDGETIAWVGPTKELPQEYLNITPHQLKGYTLLPEVVDSHTHLIFGGDRSPEYSMRLRGADYQELAKAGGGILSTMRGTRETSSEQLYLDACERIERIHSLGVGSIEIKSGYGLDIDKEYEITHTIDRLKKKYAPKIQIVNTYMAAHAIPKEYSSSKAYMDQVVFPLLEKLSDEQIIDCVDIFHEDGYFTTEDTTRLFDRCLELGLAFKSHADEFADLKGAKLAAQKGAISTDHLLRTGDDGIAALAESSTVATLLPGTGFFLGKPQANARKFLDAGCKVAIASDYNPGSCHLDNVILAASIAAPVYKMNLAEIWAAMTVNAAAAAGLKNQGALAVGMKARFSLFKVPKVDEITYSWGKNLAVDINAAII